MSDETTLMAASIVAETVPGPVKIGVGHVHVSDEVELSPLMSAVVTASVPLLDGLLRALYVMTSRTDGSPARAQVILPADIELRVISAIRAVDHPCRMCGRPARWVFDLANASTPSLVICEDCDKAVTAEARAEYTTEHGTSTDNAGDEAGTTHEYTSENGGDRRGDDDGR